MHICKNDLLAHCDPPAPQDNSGTVDVSELRAALRNMNLDLTDDNLKLLLRRLDRAQHCDELSFQEFRYAAFACAHVHTFFMNTITRHL